MRIAINQPYLVPYRGWWRLLEQTDLFVIYDDVQFIRRGYIHRNRLRRNGELHWLTLPLAHCPQETRICDLRWPTTVEAAEAEFAERRKPFEPLPLDLTIREDRPVDYIVRTMKDVCAALGIRWNVIRSSELAIPEACKGQDRILEICRRLGTSHYLNAPGGKDLYDVDAFKADGIQLEFLPPWEHSSVLDTMRIAA